MPADVRPLPAVVQPRPGESFHGYLCRNAAFYQVTLRTLITQAAGERNRRFQNEATSRALCLTATPASLERWSALFNIPVSAIEPMFLSAYDGFLQLTAREIDILDPLTDAHQRRSPLHPERGVDTTRRRYRCVRCQAVDPTRWDLRWLLTFHTICVEHHEFLLDAADPTPREAEPASQDAVEAQRRILDALADPAANRAALNRWATGIAGKGIREPLIRLVHRPEPTRPLSRLDIAASQLIGYARRSGHDPQGDDIAALVFGEQPVLAAKVLRYDDPLIVADQVAADTVLARLPRQMPTRLYYGDLSDLAYPLQLTRGRVIASGCARMYLGLLDSGGGRPCGRLHGPVPLYRGFSVSAGERGTTRALLGRDRDRRRATRRLQHRLPATRTQPGHRSGPADAAGGHPRMADGASTAAPDVAVGSLGEPAHLAGHGQC